MHKRLASETKRRRCVTLSGHDLNVIEQSIPNFSAWVRSKLEQEYPMQYWSRQHQPCSPEAQQHG